MHIRVKDDCRLRPEGLPSGVMQWLKDELEFVNPEWIRKKKFSRWMGKTPYRLSFLKIAGSGELVLPRGLTAPLLAVLTSEGLSPEVEDETRLLPEVLMNFGKELRPFQTTAVEAILARRFGVLQAPTGSGKTVVALAVAAMRKQPTLVIVHTKELLYQWREQIRACLDIEPEAVGLFGDGHARLGDRISVAIVNSLYRRVPEVNPHVGFLVVDECHKTPARTFTEAVCGFDCHYMLGLSATPYRSDGLTKLIHLYLGQQVHEVGHLSLQHEGQIMTGSVRIRTTDFSYAYRGNYQAMINRLIADQDRNRLIASDAINEAGRGRGIILVVSDRKDHCEQLERLIRQSGISSRLLTGSLPVEERKKIVEELRTGSIQVVVATLQLIGEGFDLPALSSILLGTPIRFSGRLIQAIGRILRTHAGKEEARIYDYVDKPPVLRSGFRSRMRVYRDLRLHVENPPAP